ncbi:MAG: hypothetical protein GY861_05160 [bacterium]|nr:hypothetical protein [bacterium]
MKRGNVLWRLIGKVYFNYFLEGQGSTVGKWFRSGAFSVGSNDEKCLALTNPIEVDYLEACNLAVRKELLKQIGGFDEVFAQGLSDFNEADVSFKIRRLGYRIMFNPQAVVYHLPVETFSKGRPQAYGRMINFITFYFRHIKPNTFDKILRFGSYLLFLNGYYVYNFITTRQMNQLGSIPGTAVGLVNNTFRRHQR